MENKKKIKKEAPGRKSATDNQWTSTSLRYHPDHRPRRDGPGGQ